MNNHASKCVLASRCTVANGKSCNFQCPHFIATNSRLRASGVPADYRLVSLANSPARASQPAVYKAVDAYVGTFERQFDDNGERIKSLYLWSRNTGTGKSTTASAILHEYLMTHYIGSLQRTRQALQIPARYLSANHLQQLHNKTHITASLTTKEQFGDELLREIERAKQTPFLVLDDLAVRKATQAFVGILYDICDYRTSNKLPTVYTSNKSLEELRDFFYDEDPEGKIVDRIRDMAGVLHFVGESQRGMRR